MKRLLQAISGTVALAALSACGEDRSGEYYALIGEDLWIEQTMQEHYLWYDQLPEMDEEDYFDDPADFLQSLLYDDALGGKGDSYSRLEQLDSLAPLSHLMRSSTYGMEFDLMTDPTGTTSHQLARILYVLPGSPAEAAGLQRGDWLSAVDGTELTTHNYTALMSGDATTLARQTLTLDSLGNAATWAATADTLSIGASRQMELNPFLLDTLYTVNGSRIAYLIYNECSTGPDNLETDDTYLQQMRGIFAQLKSQSPDAFILDLRYNPGGYLSCACQLASLLAPSSALGNTFCTLSYNDLTSPQTESILFDNSLAAENLNLSTLYVITSSMTASAAEAIINCLTPYMQSVVVLGEATEGQTVATEAFTNESYDFAVCPVVASVLNANGEADYTNGITPQYELPESDLFTTLLPLGDTREYLLGNAISLITTGSVTDSTATALLRTSKVVRHSLDRKKVRGIRIY